MSKMSYIVDVEGIDGTGKTTAVEVLASELKSLGLRVMVAREVGLKQHPGLVKLRELALSPDTNFGGETLELIMGAMRLENKRYYESVANQYDVIVSDRGLLSHLAYTDHWVSPQFVKEFYLNFLIPRTYAPNQIIYMNIDVETAAKRRSIRGEAADAVEAKGDSFQAKVLESFKDYIRRGSIEGQLGSNIAALNVSTVDASQSLQAVSDDIKKIAKDIKDQLNNGKA